MIVIAVAIIVRPIAIAVAIVPGAPVFVSHAEAMGAVIVEAERRPVVIVARPAGPGPSPLVAMPSAVNPVPAVATDGAVVDRTAIPRIAVVNRTVIDGITPVLLGASPASIRAATATAVFFSLRLCASA
jgi:hypothetical protein